MGRFRGKVPLRTTQHVNAVVTVLTAGGGYERKSPPNRSTFALPAIPDLTVVSRIFRTFHQATAPPVDICSA